MKKTYIWRDGEFIEITRGAVSDVNAPAVHQDSFRDGLRHPVTGEMVYDRSTWNRINKERGLRVIGNDWVDKAPGNDTVDRVGDDRIMDAIEKAHAIESNPDRRAEQRYIQQRDLERFLGRQHDVIKNIVQIKELERRR